MNETPAAGGGAGVLFEDAFAGTKPELPEFPAPPSVRLNHPVPGAMVINTPRTSGGFAEN